MATIKQIEAARRNGAKSFGPKTDDGKQRSSQNSTKHGLSGRVVVLQNESEEKFQELLESFCDHYQPGTPVERELVKEIAVARWRLRRIWAMETAMFDLEMDRQRKDVEENFSRIDEPTRLALAFTELSDNSRALSNLHRYEARLRRLSERATADLMRIQAERKGDTGCRDMSRLTGRIAKAAERVQNEPELAARVNVQNEPDKRPPTHVADPGVSPEPADSQLPAAPTAFDNLTPGSNGRLRELTRV